MVVPHLAVLAEVFADLPDVIANLELVHELLLLRNRRGSEAHSALVRAVLLKPLLRVIEFLFDSLCLFERLL
jgi:hypothetical protein